MNVNDIRNIRHDSIVDELFINYHYSVFKQAQCIYLHAQFEIMAQTRHSILALLNGTKAHNNTIFLKVAAENLNTSQQG